MISARNEEFMAPQDTALSSKVGKRNSRSGPSLLTIVLRCGRLRCAACGQGRMFAGWFRMHQQCEHCGVPFERGPGYYLGSIYFNYGLTALTVTVAYFTLYFGKILTPDQLLAALGVFCFVFPTWFFRYARCFWFGFDHYFDPMTTRRDGTKTDE